MVEHENAAYKRILNCTNITDIKEIPENTYFKLDANGKMEFITHSVYWRLSGNRRGNLRKLLE
jgi:hypothetical protein